MTGHHETVFGGPGHQGSSVYSGANRQEVAGGDGQGAAVAGEMGLHSALGDFEFAPRRAAIE